MSLFVTHHQLHEARQTPEGLHLVLGDEQDGREEITHPLDVTWTDGDNSVSLTPKTPFNPLTVTGS